MISQDFPLMSLCIPGFNPVQDTKLCLVFCYFYVKLIFLLIHFWDHQGMSSQNCIVFASPSNNIFYILFPFLAPHQGLRLCFWLVLSGVCSFTILRFSFLRTSMHFRLCPASIPWPLYSSQFQIRNSSQFTDSFLVRTKAQAS